MPMIDQMLKNGHFLMYLQTKHDAKTEQIVGAESLSRYVKNDGEPVMPDKYVFEFENDGSIIELDFLMLELACAFLAKWKENFGDLEIFPLSVNFSKISLKQDDFIERFEKIVDKYGVKHNLIEVEITEAHRFHKTSLIKHHIELLRQNGYMVAIDDYGKSSSAFSIIRHVDIDCLKIDREMVVECLEKRKTLVIFDAAVQVAKKLEMTVVAEGVETEEQLEQVRNIGCDAIQGWYFSKALPVDEFISFVKGYNNK